MVYAAIDTVPIIIGLFAASLLCFSTAAFDLLPKLGQLLAKRRKEIEHFDDSQRLIGAYMRGSITTEQFEKNAIELGFPEPMTADIIQHRQQIMMGH